MSEPAVCHSSAILVQQHWELELVTESQLGEVKMKPLSIVFATLFASELSQRVFQSNLLKTTGLCISNFIDLTMLIISLNVSRTQKISTAFIEEAWIIVYL